MIKKLKEKNKKNYLEKLKIFWNFILRNLFPIVLILIILIIYYLQFSKLKTWWIMNSLFWIKEIKDTISLEFTLTSIGSIIAFWVWFKRYERNKELEIINDINNWKFVIKSIDSIIPRLYLYELREKQYISKDIFQQIDTLNQFNFSRFVIEILKEEKVDRSELQKLSDFVLYSYWSNKELWERILQSLRNWWFEWEKILENRIAQNTKEFLGTIDYCLNFSPKRP